MVSLPVLRENLNSMREEMEEALNSGDERRHAQLKVKYENAKELLERAERLAAQHS